jgi:Raf kinase inhibitor-like YbhB/YbcL family protein
MQLTSAAFQAGDEIPSYHSSEGEDASPEVSWKDAPAVAKSFVLIMHDPDAPRRGGFTHWVVYNIPSETCHIGESVPQDGQITGVGIQGRNDGGSLGYIGPAPPSGVHRYFLRLFALDNTLDLKPGATHSEVSAKMKGHILAQAELMGTYERKQRRAA